MNPRPNSQPPWPGSAAPVRRGAVAVVVREGRFLVIRRSQSVAAPGAYCFPGGGVEEGESEEQTLRRELLEELRASVRPVRRLWNSVTAWNVELAWWLAELEGDAPLVPQPAEVQAVFWLTAEEMRAAAELLDSNRQFLDALSAGEISL